MTRLNPEEVDLAVVAIALHSACGPIVEGSIVGRTLLRDEVAKHLECSQLEAEQIVDTMIGRGFVSESRKDDGMPIWTIRAPQR